MESKDNFEMPSSDKIAEVLVTFPEKLMAKETCLVELAERVSDLGLLINAMEEKTYQEVEEEIDAEDKKKYSNEAKRKAETKKRLGLNDRYKDTIKELDKKKAELKALEIETKYMSKLFRSFLALANLKR